MDLADTFDAVARLVDSAEAPVAAVSALLDQLDEAAGHDLCVAIRRVDVEADIAALRTQLRALLETEPPPPMITAFYFGLFDAADAEGAETIGFYIAGVERFDPADG